MGRFDGKTAIVTGAGSGMGREVAEQLVAEGAKVIALDLEFPDDVLEPSAQRPSIVHQRHDVTSPESWDIIAKELSHPLSSDTDAEGEGEGGVGIDILVNAAGVMDYGPLHETELDDWRRTLSVDLDGVMLGMRAVIPLMRRRANGGAIVNFSSALATAALPGSPAYHAAKAAVTQLTRNAAVTYAADGIRVNAVHPGIVATPLVLRRQQPAALALSRAAVARTPLGRMGTAREIARCVLFMLSDDAAFMTGAALVVDGGFSLH